MEEKKVDVKINVQFQEQANKIPEKKELKKVEEKKIDVKKVDEVNYNNNTEIIFVKSNTFKILKIHTIIIENPEK